MSYDKLCRGRRILGSVNSLVRDQYGRRATTYPADDLVSVNMPGIWSATITRNSSSAEAAAGNLPREKWDFLHVHADDNLVLALRFCDRNSELIRYVPGHWERWFGTFDLADDQPYPPI